MVCVGVLLLLLIDMCESEFSLGLGNDITACSGIINTHTVQHGSFLQVSFQKAYARTVELSTSRFMLVLDGFVDVIIHFVMSKRLCVIMQFDVGMTQTAVGVAEVSSVVAINSQQLSLDKVVQSEGVVAGIEECLAYSEMRACGRLQIALLLRMLKLSLLPLKQLQWEARTNTHHQEHYHQPRHFPILIMNIISTIITITTNKYSRLAVICGMLVFKEHTCLVGTM